MLGSPSQRCPSSLREASQGTFCGWNSQSLPSAWDARLRNQDLVVSSLQVQAKLIGNLLDLPTPWISPASPMGRIPNEGDSSDTGDPSQAQLIYYCNTVWV